MVMFLQAFRFAYEPFVFSKHREGGMTIEQKLNDYSRVMTWFVAVGFLIFLGVMEFLPVLRYFISPAYFEGLKVVPVIMLGELFFGVFFNLSIWYKLTDKTIWGSYFSIIGLAITVTLNILLVPRMGYMGCAWAAISCYGMMMILSYIIGQYKFKVPYRLGRLLTYAVAALALYGLGELIKGENELMNLGLGTLLILMYVALVARLELRGITLKNLLKR